MKERKSAHRLVSLDALRRFTVAEMIIVNPPGSWDHVFAPFLHASWHGITPTDCVFPFFIFIVGISITLSYGKMLAAGIPKSNLVGKTLNRDILIFIIALFIGIFPDFNFDEFRFPQALLPIHILL